MTDVFVHIDDTSFGIYPIPGNVVVMDPGPTVPTGFPVLPLGNFCIANQLDDELRITGPVDPVRRDTRINAHIKDPVCSWLKISPTGAPPALFRAMSGFWLNRYRLTRDLRSLFDGPRSVQLQLSSLTEPRKPLREALLHHGRSLEQKTWALFHHRGALNGAFDALQQSPQNAYHLMCATAEYNAMTACMYSILEEITHAFSIFDRIRFGTSRPGSFHQLHSKRDKQEAPLKSILDEATWYEGFRLRRANAAHAFGTVVALDPSATDIFLFQHPEPVVYSKSPTPPPAVQAARTNVSELARGFDRLIERYSAHLLTLFHPWDLVIVHRATSHAEKMEAIPVWVRNLIFDEKLRRSTDAWVCVDDHGDSVFYTDEKGGLRLG
jgi:hypothetical protein